MTQPTTRAQLRKAQGFLEQALEAMPRPAAIAGLVKQDVAITKFYRRKRRALQELSDDLAFIQSQLSKPATEDPDVLAQRVLDATEPPVVHSPP